jgi:hypothetical protein
MKFLSMICAEKIREGTTGWIHCCCPLARWTHSGGSDSRPSFGIKVSESEKSGYKCHGCQSHGSLDDLAWRLNKFSGWKLNEVVDFVNASDQMSLAMLSDTLDGSQSNWYKKSKTVSGLVFSPADIKKVKESEVDDTIPEKVLKDIISAFPEGVMQYLTWAKPPMSERKPEDKIPRGMTQDTINKFELGWDKKYKRIVIPVRDATGRLVGMTGRAFYSFTNPKFFHYPGFLKSRYLFGEYLAKKDGIGYLVEGHFDVMMLHQNGYPQAVATMGSYLSDIQVMKICRFFKEVVYIRDGDTPGKEAENRIRSTLSGHIKMSAIEIPEGYDPDDLSKTELENLLGKPS